MKVLKFTQILMKIGAVLPVFDESIVGKLIEIFKKIVLTLPLIYAFCTCFAFTIVHIDNLSRVAAPMYVNIAALIAFFLNISFSFQTESAKLLFKHIEAMANERMKNFGNKYYQTDCDVTIFTKRIIIYWFISLSILVSVPYLLVLVDYLTGNYSLSSWKPLFETLYPWNMTDEFNLLLEMSIQGWTEVPSIVYPILSTQFLFFAIVQYFSTFIEDVKEMIKQFDPSNLRERFIEMINLHSKSLILAKEFARIMNAPIFIIITLILVCLCTILLQFKDSLSRHDYANLHLSLTAFCFVIQVVFSFCYLGAQLTAKAAEVNEAIYGSEWYTYPPNMQMFMVLIMRRAQKPFIMTGYSLVSCSLQSFKDMLNFVASVFVLLMKFSK